ncbi:hypothetical protein G647_00091 [Cladophialophora carrionii CBS 160.54]|uniref:Uncharacterized protein n=1 Tax=Cladophialophora carrionii CBS 160.54 TaxID=1279043 RepID=V9DNV6_9EURO|nr:uncharacterized protein G647_00091 [Cladophialophora carrionii CBS 160.54]ETI27642.1 hypothetical protein G647_00091 [Cladophialophora carrionii CBS 160.54]
MAYFVGLGCCMNARHPQLASTPRSRSPLEEIKTGNINWSASTLGIETDLTLTLRAEAIRSDPSMPDVRDIPLSSMEFFNAPLPSPSPALPPPVASPQSRPRREKRRGIDSPVVTVTDHDIVTGTTPSTGECQHERQERHHHHHHHRQRRQSPQRDRDRETVVAVRAWSQIDPLYGMYQREREQQVQRDRQTQTQSRNRFADIRGFEFLSYGGWIVI